MPFPAASNAATLTGTTLQKADTHRNLATQKKPAAATRAFHGSDLLLVLMNPLTVIFLIAAIASSIVGNPLDAAILSFVVLASATMDSSQRRVSTVPLQTSPPTPSRRQVPNN
jgi:hypothetical protein